MYMGPIKFLIHWSGTKSVRKNCLGTHSFITTKPNIAMVINDDVI